MIQKTLNPRFWPQGKLAQPVRRALIRSARDFTEDLDLAPEQVLDLVLTGSMATYLWHSGSDLDLHLVVDMKKIPCDIDPKDYFEKSRHLWNTRRDVWIWGHEVEVYVEDVSEPTPGARWSLRQNQWLQTPPPPPQDFDPRDLEPALKTWLKRLERSKDDPDRLSRTIDELRQHRSQALRTQGEYAETNLVYRQLRAWGLLAQARTLITRSKDRELGLGGTAQ